MARIDPLNSPPCCMECGATDSRITELRQLVEQKEQVIVDVERELRVKRGTISRMTREKMEAQDAHPLIGWANQVFDYWRAELAPGAREFTGKRFDNVVARLNAGVARNVPEADVVAELKEAIDGAKARPYVTDYGRVANGRPSERNVELELICRTEAHVTRFRQYAQEAAKSGQQQINMDSPAARAGAESGQRRKAIASAETITAWIQNLQATPGAVERLCELRAWTPPAIRWLRLGLNQEGRIVFPARDAHGTVVGLVKYQPNPAKRGKSPKSIAEGPRELFPPPEVVKADRVWLVEGESDAVAMISMGLPAVAVPGVATWNAGWAHRFEKFEYVYVLFDCDRQGREAAEARARSIATVTRSKVVDLDSTVDDGTDVGDWLMKYGPKPTQLRLEELLQVGSTVVPLAKGEELGSRDPVETVRAVLESRDLRPTKGTADSFVARCPVHDDHRPSLSITRGHDGRALLHCFANCSTIAIMEALGLTWKDLFAA